MIWTIIGALMPWTTILLFGALAYQIRKNKKLDEAGWIKTSQIRDLSARVDSFKAENNSLRGQLELIAIERERLEIRLRAAQARASELEVKATATAMRMGILSDAERLASLNGLLVDGLRKTDPNSGELPSPTDYR